MSLRLTGIRHAFGQREILRGVDLHVRPGEILCLLGPSGCGKTTLLRLVAGLEELQAGRIELGGALVGEKGREVPPEQRHVGFVFQDYALFPHLTVAENVAFGLHRIPRGERPWAVTEALARVGLETYAHAYPHMLSGGQQQRVALARALAPRPQVVLLDEAFASLDARLREQVRDDTLHVLQSAGIPAMIVTHDAEEAMFLADRIALMQEGRVIQLGRPEELYLAPADPFVATFLGEVNRLPARIRGARAETAIGPLPLRPGADLAEGPAEVLLRPEGLRVQEEGGTPAEVEACRLLGATTLVHLAVADGAGGLLHLHARLPPGIRLSRGQRVTVAMDPERAFVFPPAAP
ncbi:ABC transporter ATP-binding protein [Paracraurococcus lichenis]|uniref:ABC transporter ATP-binding protein n=1 Tax=Paracraurococcus lichenis TaxID=3064888 RepID=A0ABT9DXP9_9PROT|nr:ABC transporter ATP-binding protein [Paracraurococcus sp. LOR1-02]MDO9708663.1 ABC transporter ATP-binding protein [Paracraurococcus sp. LOR1-02]